jgi:hypothetical protein
MGPKIMTTVTCRTYVIMTLTPDILDEYHFIISKLKYMKSSELRYLVEFPYSNMTIRAFQHGPRSW